MLNNSVITPKETSGSLMESAVMGGAYCSIPMDSDENRKKVFNASNTADYALRDKINISIEMVGLYIEPVAMQSKDDDGNLIDGTTICPRMIIFDKDGKSYGCCSFGVYNAMKRLVTMYGLPDTWGKPVTIIPLLISKGKNQILSIKLG